MHVIVQHESAIGLSKTLYEDAVNNIKRDFADKIISALAVYKVNLTLYFIDLINLSPVTESIRFLFSVNKVKVLLQTLVNINQRIVSN